jgi:DNA topoisomerase-2
MSVKNAKTDPKLVGQKGDGLLQSIARAIKASRFFNSAFKEFSLYDNVRSIPTLFDGLKPSQRKVIYGMQLRGENAAEIQVERVAAQIAANTDYHHGTGSLESTIVGMANNYAGTNNMNLLIPSGQFGSRLTKEAASGRYILTKFSENFRKLYKKEDDSILENILVDGEKIEPKFYIPLLPMVLVNGAQGTGTGHACLIMNYHPEAVRDACLKVVLGKKLPMNTLVPWFNGFSGDVERVEETGQVVVTGALEVVNTTTIKITELPVGVYLDQYKEFLNKLEDSGFIKDYEDRSTEEGFDFTINAPRSTTALDEEVLYQKFKLISRDTENFTLWNEKGVLERFDTAEDIVERFVVWRLARYEDRRQKLISDTKESIRWMSEKLRFILFYLENVNAFKNKRKDDLVTLLLKNDFVDYDRLLAMPMWNLTHDKIEELKKDIAESKRYLATLEADTAHEMYKRELKEFKAY